MKTHLVTDPDWKGKKELPCDNCTLNAVIGIEFEKVWFRLCFPCAVLLRKTLKVQLKDFKP